jgi:hypothetical protein
MHTDPFWTLDSEAGTLLTIHLNLFVGTVVMYAGSRPDLQALLQDALEFNVVSAFRCLTFALITYSSLRSIEASFV